MADGRTFGCWLSGELRTKAERRAQEVADGNESKWVRSLIERDLAGGAPAVSDEHILIELARRYHPSLVDQITAVLAVRSTVFGERSSQRLVVARLLDALVRAADDMEFDPSREFDLVDRKTRAQWEAISSERIRALAQEIAALRPLHAAEPRGRYDTEKTAPTSPRAKRARREKPLRNAKPVTGQPLLAPHDRSQPA